MGVYSESNDENITLPCDRLQMYSKYEQWIHNRTWNETNNETWEERSKPARNKRWRDEPNSFISFWEEENFPKHSCTFHTEDYESDENITLPCDFFQRYERHNEIWDNYDSTLDEVNFTDFPCKKSDEKDDKKRKKYNSGYHNKQEEHNGTEDDKDSFYRDDQVSSEEENIDAFDVQEN